MIFFHSYKNPGLMLDIVEGEVLGGDGRGAVGGPGPTDGRLPTDLRLINTQAIFAKRTGMIILGGGVVKHHIANANLMVSECRGPQIWMGGQGKSKAGSCDCNG